MRVTRGVVHSNACYTWSATQQCVLHVECYIAMRVTRGVIHSNPS